MADSCGAGRNLNPTASPSGCPMDGLLRLLSGPWTLYLLWVLDSNGAMRFGVLRRALDGVSAKVLTERLRMLADAGIISRHAVTSVPPEVSYALTPRGKELRQAMCGLHEIAMKWAAEDEMTGS